MGAQLARKVADQLALNLVANHQLDKNRTI